MSEPVTFEMLAWFIGIGLGILGWAGGWLVRRVSALDRALSDYKLEVAEKYATTTHLQEVESRIFGELANLNRTMSGIGRDVNRMMGRRGIGDEGP